MPKQSSKYIISTKRNMRRWPKLTNNREIETARTKCNAVLNLKASEGDIQWIVVNTIIIGFISFTYNKDFNFPIFFRILFWLIPLFGFLFSIVWYKMTERGFMWTRFWIDKAWEIETQINGEVNPIQEGRDKMKEKGEGYTRTTSLSIIICFAVVYALIFFTNILSLHTSLIFLLYYYW